MAVADGGDARIGGAHAAFEMFYADLDAGLVDRAVALGGLAALMSIVAKEPRESPEPRVDIKSLAYASRDRMLVRLIVARGSALPDIDSYGGWIGRISIERDEIDSIVRDHQPEVAMAGLADVSQVIGHFLIVRSARGDTLVREFATPVMRDAAFDNIAAVWAGRRGPLL